MMLLTRILYGLLIFSIPFNGLIEIIPVGEFSGDGFFYMSLPFNAMMTFMVITKRKNLPVSVARPVAMALLFFISVFLLFSVINITRIFENATPLRSGVSKFILSYGAFLYYAFTFVLISVMASIMGTQQFVSLTVQSCCLSAAFMVIVSLFEVLGWFNSVARGALIGFRNIFTSQPIRIPFRISGVSYEPSFFGISMLLMMPWVAEYAKQKRNLSARMLFIFLAFFCVISGSRTAVLGIAAFLIIQVLMKSPWRSAFYITIGIPATSAVLGLLIPIIAFEHVDSFSSVSNVTRSFLTSRAVMLGIDNPFGVGFGQVPFYLVQQMDSSIRNSWELESWYSGSRAGELSPVFTWYGRTIGEIGIVGYALCTAFISIKMFALAKYGKMLTDETLERMLFHVFSGYVAIFLAVGLSSDSYKFLPFWFMILTYGLVMETRFKLVNLDPNLVDALPQYQSRKK